MKNPSLFYEDGYTSSQHLQGHYKRMTVEEAKKLIYGNRVHANVEKKVVLVTILGKPKTWKTKPNKVQVSLKFGMYSYFTDTVEGELMDYLLVPSGE